MIIWNFYHEDKSRQDTSSPVSSLTNHYQVNNAFNHSSSLRTPHTHPMTFEALSYYMSSSDSLISNIEMFHQVHDYLHHLEVYLKIKFLKSQLTVVVHTSIIFNSSIFLIHLITIIINNLNGIIKFDISCDLRLPPCHYLKPDSSTGCFNAL